MTEKKDDKHVSKFIIIRYIQQILEGYKTHRNKITTIDKRRK